MSWGHTRGRPAAGRRYQQGCMQASLFLVLVASHVSGVAVSCADDSPSFSSSSVTVGVPPWPIGPFVTLRGGGVLAGRLISISHNAVEIESVPFGRLRFALEAICGYRQTIGDMLRIEAGRPRTTPIRLTLTNGDQVAAESLSVLAGQCETQLLSPHVEERLVLPLTRVLAIDFSAPTHHGRVSEPAMDETIVWVALEDGSRFPVRANSVGKLQGAGDSENVVHLQPTSLPPLETLQCPVDELVSRMPQQAGQWLACRQPTRVARSLAKLPVPVDVPLLSLPDGRQLIAGSTWMGGWPRLRGLTGFSAIAIHSPCCAEYVFKRSVQRFAAVVGIDDSAGQGGSVILRVTVVLERSAQDKEVVRGTLAEPQMNLKLPKETEVFRSGLVRGGEPPLLLDLNLGPTKCLRLYVEPARGGNVLDRTLWLDPRVK